jgi:hypothetical protein
MSRQLFSLGSVHPLGSPEGPSRLRVECLTAGTDPRIEVAVGFVQAVERQVLDASGRPAGDLIVAGRRYSSGEEAEEREVHLSPLPNRTATIRTAGAERAELTEDGAPAGALVWRWERLHGTVEAWSEEVLPGLYRVLVEVANRLEWDRATPEQNLMRTLRSTQVEVDSFDSVFASPDSAPADANRFGHPALR